MMFMVPASKEFPITVEMLILSKTAPKDFDPASTLTEFASERVTMLCWTQTFPFKRESIIEPWYTDAGVLFWHIMKYEIAGPFAAPVPMVLIEPR
jgi:hypothetical protein